MLSKKEFEKQQVEYEKNCLEELKGLNPQTLCIHAGQEPDLVTGAVNVPIYQSSTFKQYGKGMDNFFYTRLGNPTRHALEKSLAVLEHGKHAIVWSSGMSSITGVINLLNEGDECLSVQDLYGGTQVLFRDLMPKKGIKVKMMSFDDADKVVKEVTEKTKLIYMESATNPALSVPDVKAISEGAKAINKDVIVVVDNTFASPINFTPLDYGADIVVESITKYINGHTDVVMGLTVTKDDALFKRLYEISVNFGGTCSPFDCFLVLRGVKTLELRVREINKNALAVAKFLEKHEMVEKVMYPGLESSPYHEKASKQFKGYGGIVSFIMKGEIELVEKFLKSLKVFCLAVSLGGVESLAENPATMTHACVKKEVREELGIVDGLIRLSVGCKFEEDLINDLKNAFDSCKK